MKHRFQSYSPRERDREREKEREKKIKKDKKKKTTFTHVYHLGMLWWSAGLVKGDTKKKKKEKISIQDSTLKMITMKNSTMN